MLLAVRHEARPRERRAAGGDDWEDCGVSMVPFLRHHLARAERGYQYNAIANCHAEGLASIVLHDEPENRIRMFVAGHDHSLSRNRGGRMSIAIHPHHCDLRFVGLFGRAHNDVYALTPNAAGQYMEMAYTSAITSGTGSLTPTGARADVHLLRSEALMAHPEMRAHELHTIYLPECAQAAWLVIEGAENPAYESKCWTNDEAPNLRGLYQPMDPRMVALTLGDVLRQTERAVA